MGNLQSFKSNIAVPPGETLLEELEYLNINQKELSEKTGISQKNIKEIIIGKAPITSSIALKLEKALGVNANFWNNLERNYRLDLERIKGKNIKVEKKILSRISIKETCKESV